MRPRSACCAKAAGEALRGGKRGVGGVVGERNSDVLSLCAVKLVAENPAATAKALSYENRREFPLERWIVSHDLVPPKRH